MLWSVWNYSSRLYDYYEGGARRGTHASAPPRPPLQSEIGATPEGAAWHLPIGVRKIGSGPMPRGRVASSGLNLGSLGDLTELPRIGIIAGVAYLLWRVLK